MPFKDPEARRRYIREYYQKNREKQVARAAQYRAEHPDKVSAAKSRLYHEVYKHDPDYKARMSASHKKRRRERYDEVREIERRSQEKNKERRAEYQRAYSKTPQRKGHEAVRKAIASGSIPPASSLECLVCRVNANEYHHHLGYEKKHRLSVVPLCHQCHKDIHAGIAHLPSYST